MTINNSLLAITVLERDNEIHYQRIIDRCYFEYVDPVFHGWNSIRVGASEDVVAMTKALVELVLMCPDVFRHFLHMSTTPCVTLTMLEAISLPTTDSS